MANFIKSGTTISNGTIKRNNFIIGISDSLGYGPTETTGFWTSINPPSCGYTIYTQKASQGPSIFISDDVYLIITAQKLGGTNINTVYDALSWFNGQQNHMVTNFDYPSIVTSGLTLMFDAGYLPSYPRTGNTVNDLSGNNSNTTLFNSPTFSLSNIGILNFSDTSLQYGLTPNLGNLSQWTVESWFKLDSLLTGKVTSIISNEYDGSNLNFSIGTNNTPTNSNLAVGFYNGAWRSTTGFVPTTNVWYQVVGTYDGSTIRQYINGVASGGTLNYVGTPTSGGGVRLMRRWDDTATSSNFVNGKLAIAYVYNRALSSTEVLQNYNSLSPRFEPSVTPCPTPIPPGTPTLTINWTREPNVGSAAVDVYKNGVYYGSPTSGVAFNVPIVAGDTFYITIIPESVLGAYGSYDYYVNGGIQANGYNTVEFSSATYTASGTNIYTFDVLTYFPT
jgi:hypothetical protein